MGTVYETNKHLITHYAAGIVEVDNALITPGQDKVVVKVAEVDADEVKRLLQKVDAIANSYMNEAVAVTFAETFPVILTAMRMVKEETKEPFKGTSAHGRQLNIIKLTPEDVGGRILNSNEKLNKGLYGGMNSGVYVWSNPMPLIAGTNNDLIPEQTMSDYAAVVHIGAINAEGFHKINKISFALSGIQTQLLPLIPDIKDKSFVQLKPPILVLPFRLHKVTIHSIINGYSRFELVSVIIATANML